jgi:hypothetical protein
VILTGADRHDVTQLHALVDAIPPIGGNRDSPLLKPQVVPVAFAQMMLATYDAISPPREKIFMNRLTNQSSLSVPLPLGFAFFPKRSQAFLGIFAAVDGLEKLVGCTKCRREAHFLGQVHHIACSTDGQRRVGCYFLSESKGEREQFSAWHNMVHEPDFSRAFCVDRLACEKQLQQSALLDHVNRGRCPRHATSDARLGDSKAGVLGRDAEVAHLRQ